MLRYRSVVAAGRLRKLVGRVLRALLELRFRFVCGLLELGLGTVAVLVAAR